MIDAARRASARRTGAVIPYFGYARQEERPAACCQRRACGKLNCKRRADRVITYGLTRLQVQGFFDIPVDHLYCSQVFMESFKKNENSGTCHRYSRCGCGIKWRGLCKHRLHGDLIVIDKKKTETERCRSDEYHRRCGRKNVMIVDELN